MKIADLLKAGPTRSVEFFPPKTPEGRAQLDRTVEELAPLELSFVSVTYGAGGTTRDVTRDLVVELNHRSDHPAMPHLTCIGHRREEVEALLRDYVAAGISNILALAGDPPADGSPVEGDFTYASELVALVRDRADMSVGVAAFPECHPRSPNREHDRRHLADKLEAADFAITQFFYDPDDYFRLVDELEALGVTKPVLPGIMPMTNPTSIRRFAEMNGARFPEELAAAVESAGSEAEALEIAADAAVELCTRLLEGGAPGLHVYCLNRSATARAIFTAVG